MRKSATGFFEYPLVLIVILTMSMRHTDAQSFEFNYNRDFKKILSETNDPANNLYYEKLVQRFKSNDTTFTNYQILALLIGFTDNVHFKPYDYLSIERRIYSLNGDGKYTDAILLADSLLRYVPVSQQALIETSYAHYKLNQMDSADYCMWKFREIMRTMSMTGDGLTPETAIFSLGPADGQNYIRKGLVSNIGAMGSGRDKQGNFLDILTASIVDEKTGETRNQTMYFQIQHAVEKMFEPDELDQAIRKQKKGKGKLKD